MKINNGILHQPDFFTQLVDEEKKICESEIILSQQNNNARWLIGSSEAKLESRSEAIDFIVKINKTVNKYGIMLKCPALCDKPYFRFDSDGPSHQNVDTSIKLEERQVPTPHFNTYDIMGREFAYQNEVLKNASEAIVISNNLEFGISLFCIETKSFVDNDVIPVCIDSTTLPNFEIESEFNLNNIKFE